MERTRRSLLAAGATAGVVGVAGCLGGGGGDGNGGELSLDTGSYDCSLSEPTDPNLDYRPTLGDPDADVVVRAFEDFTCGHCATYNLDHFPTIREEYVDPGRVRYEHWDFPIPVNERWAVPVASAARGVGIRHDDEAFFEFAKAAYESQGNYSGEALGSAAETAGADPCAVLSDAEFSTYEAATQDDRSEGSSMGVEGTPTIFVNGEPVEGGYAAETVAAAIDAEL
ncbi:disulfide bond formation protein DsbA [Halorubrum ezzemoulense DSM 17463]|uniref:Disulfide bond formation protein DsbA n=1 Tax=Halorubrum ezzemoulense DSM 17463 TaxID=1121945 RepID=A0A1X4HAE1_HALEZ|nr:thioredoxin domain-containing protein [Halorubrum ezzemoulense]OSP10082.1 disulfide bond formation protein DsbA [Halorubrum ezzemoulense DSM 17463]